MESKKVLATFDIIFHFYLMRELEKYVGNCFLSYLQDSTATFFSFLPRLGMPSKSHHGNYIFFHIFEILSSIMNEMVGTI